MYADRGDKDIVLGHGLRVVKQVPLSSAGGETSLQSAGFDIKDSEKRIFASLSAKPMTYLSQFILHVAAIGDIVDGTDTTHDFNFFSVVYEWPKDVRFLKYLNYLTMFDFRHNNYHVMKPRAVDQQWIYFHNQKLFSYLFYPFVLQSWKHIRIFQSLGKSIYVIIFNKAKTYVSYHYICSVVTIFVFTIMQPSQLTH